VEIREEVGAENFFLFGLTAEQVHGSWMPGSDYDPMALYRGNEQLRAVLDLISEGHFSRGDRELFRPIVDSLLGRDNYRLMGDFASYVEAQAQVSAVYADPERWTRMSILNVARMGKFSSDRSIRDYCRDIWRVRPTKIKLLSEDEVTADLLQ
jgi:starch phosphorylase